MPQIREPILAGRWYEGNPAALAASMAENLEGRGRPPVPLPEDAAQAQEWTAAGRYPTALIVPHAGHVYSGACAGATFRMLRGGPCRRVILLGPSHQFGFHGAALPEEDAWKTPLGAVSLDRAAIAALERKSGFESLPRAHATEHSLEIELPFLQSVLAPGFLLLPIVIGRLTEELVASIGHALRALWDTETILAVSSDFTHYGPNYDYIPFHEEVPANLRRMDMEAVRRILELDRSGFETFRESVEATICGAEPIRILLEAARDRGLSARLIDYYRSGDLTGDYRNCVSYAGLAFFERRPDDDEARRARTSRPLNLEEQAMLLKLARDTITGWLEGRSTDARDLLEVPANSPIEEERGVFVTLTTPGRRLRGCIGSIIGEGPLIDSVVQNAIASASRDPRFMPVDRDELTGLHIEISVLTPLIQVPGPESIVIGRDGVVLEKEGRRAVFLPQVAPEQGWDVTQMLRHLSMKAGLGSNEWQKGARLYTFTAQVFEEDPPLTRNDP